MANAALQAFNKTAVLTVYPTGFTFTSGADIQIIATTDAGGATVLYNKGVWLDRAGFVAPGDDLSVGNGYSLSRFCI
jgi:hypothetical protein